MIGLWGLNSESLRVDGAGYDETETEPPSSTTGRLPRRAFAAREVDPGPTGACATVPGVYYCDHNWRSDVGRWAGPVAVTAH